MPLPRKIIFSREGGRNKVLFKILYRKKFRCELSGDLVLFLNWLCESIYCLWKISNIPYFTKTLCFCSIASMLLANASCVKNVCCLCDLDLPLKRDEIFYNEIIHLLLQLSDFVTLLNAYFSLIMFFY